MEFDGTWHIYEMEMWDEDYFNMEVQAYIEINSNANGKFHFGLVRGYFNGKMKKVRNKEKLDFTWEGNDENDPASGSGWIKMEKKDVIEGRIKFHMGDISGFSARRFK